MKENLPSRQGTRVPREPSVCMKDGDEVAVEIKRIGRGVDPCKVR